MRGLELLRPSLAASMITLAVTLRRRARGEGLAGGAAAPTTSRGVPDTVARRFSTLAWHGRQAGDCEAAVWL